MGLHCTLAVFIQRSLRSRCTSAVIAAAICPSASGHWLPRLCCATNSRASSAASEARSSGTSKLRSSSSPRETGSTNSVVGGDGGGGRGVITTASRGCASVSRTACATASTSVGPSGESSPCSRSATYQSATWRPAHPLASVYGSRRAWRRRKANLRRVVAFKHSQRHIFAAQLDRYIRPWQDAALHRGLPRGVHQQLDDGPASVFGRRAAVAHQPALPTRRGSARAGASDARTHAPRPPAPALRLPRSPAAPRCRKSGGRGRTPRRALPPSTAAAAWPARPLRPPRASLGARTGPPCAAPPAPTAAATHRTRVAAAAGPGRWPPPPPASSRRRPAASTRPPAPPAGTATLRAPP